MNSNIENYVPTLLILDDDITTDTEDLEEDFILDEDIESNNPSEISIDLSDDESNSPSKTIKKKLVGEKRRIDDSDSNTELKPQKSFKVSYITDCKELIPGIYRINDNQNFYIEIIASIPKGKKIYNELKDF